MNFMFMSTAVTATLANVWPTHACHRFQCKVDKIHNVLFGGFSIMVILLIYDASFFIKEYELVMLQIMFLLKQYIELCVVVTCAFLKV